jgi:hypothetical protein
MATSLTQLLQYPNFPARCPKKTSASSSPQPVSTEGTGLRLLKGNLKLIDGEELVDLVYKYYPQLDAKYKGLIPLRQVYIPETLTD